MAVLAKTGISQTLVKQILGAGSYGIGILCTHVNINMFSKYKPVRYPADCVDGIPNWWKSKNNNCGINIPVINNATEAGNKNWTFEPPRGNASEPYRLGDFRGYNHNAYPILSPGFQGKYSVNKITTTRLSLMCLIAVQSEVNLYYGDILSPQLASLYFAVEIYTSAGARKVTATSDKTIGDGGSSIEINISNFNSGDYTMYFFLRTSKQLQDDPAMAAINYAIYHDATYLNPVPLSIKSEAPLRFEVLEIGYSLSGTFRSVNDFMNGYALQSNGYVTFKIRATGIGGFAAVNFKIASFNFWDESVEIGLANAIYDENKSKVTSVRLSASGGDIFYINANVFSIKGGMSVAPPLEKKRIYAFCQFKLMAGSITNMTTVGMVDFPVVSGSMGMIIKDPGVSL